MMEKVEGGVWLSGRRVLEGHSCCLLQEEQEVSGRAQERLAGDTFEPRPLQQVELDRFCSSEPRPGRCCGALLSRGRIGAGDWSPT